MRTSAARREKRGVTSDASRRLSVMEIIEPTRMRRDSDRKRSLTGNGGLVTVGSR